MQPIEYTVHEHYIPVFYLKQFSPDQEKIFEYDVLNGRNGQLNNPVPIRSICREKNLYEFKDLSGNFAYRNLIEKRFQLYEGEFSKVFRSIRSKTHYEVNYDTRCFLNKYEKAMLIFFLSTVILRNPDILRVAQETAKEFFGDQLSGTEAKNLALLTCLPIYKDIDVQGRNILNSVMQWFENMSFQIGCAEKELLWTSDNPVILFGESCPVKPEQVFMPLSPKLVLFMKSMEKTNKECYNRLVSLENQDVEFINEHIVMHSKRWIYSKSLLTEKQIKWISKKRSSL